MDKETYSGTAICTYSTLLSMLNEMNTREEIHRMFRYENIEATLNVIDEGNARRLKEKEADNG